MIRDKKFKIGLVLTFVLMTILCCTLLCTPLAFADYSDLNGSEILNFNQYVKNDYVNKGSVNTGSNELTNGYSLSNGHLFYVKLYVYFVNASSIEFNFNRQNDDDSISRTILNTSNTSTDFILNNTQVYKCRMTCYAPNNSLNISCMVIDLTQMFGSGNEPNIEQCQALFVSDYYQYNTGTPLSFDTIQSYNNGVNAVLSNVDIISATPSDFYNSVQSFTYNDSYGGNITKYSNAWIWLTNTANDHSICQLPLQHAVPGNATCTLTGLAYGDFGSGSTTNNYFQIAIIQGQTLNIIANSPIIGTNESGTSFEFSFTMPSSYVDSIYLIGYRGGYSYYFKNVYSFAL